MLYQWKWSLIISQCLEVSLSKGLLIKGIYILQVYACHLLTVSLLLREKCDLTKTETYLWVRLTAMMRHSFTSPRVLFVKFAFQVCKLNMGQTLQANLKFIVFLLISTPQLQFRIPKQEYPKHADNSTMHELNQYCLYSKYRRSFLRLLNRIIL